MIADAHVDILLELAHREHRLGETGVFARTWLPLLEAGGVGLQVCPVFVDLEYQPEGSLREALRQVTALAARGSGERRPRHAGADARRSRRGRARRADRPRARARRRRAVRLRGRDRRSLLGARPADGRADLEPAQSVRRRRRRRGRPLGSRTQAAGAVRRAGRDPRSRPRLAAGLRRVPRVVRGTRLRHPRGLPRSQRHPTQPFRRTAARARRPGRHLRPDAAPARDRSDAPDDRPRDRPPRPRRVGARAGPRLPRRRLDRSASTS